MDEALDFTINVVDEVGRRLLDIFDKKERVCSEKKSDGSLITDADIEANNTIISRIESRFPDHRILTEEGRTGCPDAHDIWIIDPLDGTTNFSWGIPIWGVSIALVRGGELELGVVAFPALRRVYHAVRGRGAYSNNVLFRTEPLTESRDNQVFLTCTNTLKNYSLGIPYKLRVVGSASYNLVKVADGGAAGGMEFRPKIWDIAAGQLIIEEAGSFFGFPYTPPYFPVSPGTDYGDVSLPMITANNREIYESLIKQIKPRNNSIC
jgi:myo-inositol-1(or 4)-monophosphatase